MIATWLWVTALTIILVLLILVWYEEWKYQKAEKEARVQLDVVGYKEFLAELKRAQKEDLK